MKADDAATDQTRDENPYWLSLLTYFEHRGYIYNGLTIPFLIGARTFVVTPQSLLSIDELAEELSEVGCTILKCGDIGELVVGTLDADTVSRKYLYKTIGENIIVVDSSLDHIDTLEQLMAELNTSYANLVESGCYSKSYGDWSSYSEIDLRRLSDWAETYNH